MKGIVVLGLVAAVAACGGGKAAEGEAKTPGGAGPADPASAPAAGSGAASAPASSSASAPASAPTPAAAPPPATGGSILIGDIAAAKKFDPKVTVTSIQQQLLDCYNKVRGAKPELHGKIKLRVVVNDTGAAVNVTPDPADDLAKEDALVSCLSDVLHAAKFPKPGGMATVTVPLLFRP